jgi:hypothetical protein
MGAGYIMWIRRTNNGFCFIYPYKTNTTISLHSQKKRGKRFLCLRLKKGSWILTLLFLSIFSRTR